MYNIYDQSLTIYLLYVLLFLLLLGITMKNKSELDFTETNRSTYHIYQMRVAIIMIRRVHGKMGTGKKGTGKKGTEKRAQEKWAQEKRAQVKN